MTEVEVSLDVEIFGQELELIGTIGEEETSLSVLVEKPPTLAELIESFARLLVPGFELRVPPPWDALVDFRPPPFILTVSGETMRLAIDQTVTIVDGILDISSIELVYNSDEEELAVVLGLTLLGKDLKDITWDPIEEPAPTIDTETARTFELEYLGLGQRMAPSGPTPETMDAAMDLLMSTGGDAGSALQFDPEAGWLFATRFTAMDTVDLDLVFWDPHLYGLVVKLRGDQAGSLDGLRFEILYRKVDEHLGVYHADIELPTVLRRVELGAASLTLPAASIDIYTDGSFLIDLGFPHDLDFSRSASVEIFPFVGQGGVYFGKLPPEAVPQLPAVTDPARFGPVIAVGLGVNVGVGKTIEMGVLSAGATVTMVGIFEGLIAPYRDAAGSQAGLYYRVTAQVGLIGHIYGTVNFGIVQAQVDIIAMATVSVTIESHRAATVLLEASVSVQLEVRVLFVTLYFSFDATVRAEFIIGDNTTAPWDLPAGGTPLQLNMASAPPAIETATGPAFAMVAPSPPAAADRIKIPLRLVPQVTIGTDESGEPTVAVTCMLMVDMTEPESGPSDFGRLVDACFSWTVDIIGDEGSVDDDTELNRHSLRRLQQQLGGSRTGSGDQVDFRPEHRLTPEAVLEFWEQNFTHTLGPWTGGTADATSRHAFFPMNPGHQLEVSKNDTVIHRVDFATNKPCSPAYQRSLDDWFGELRVVAEAETKTELPYTASASAGDDPTLAALLKVDYFRTILRVTVGDALKAFDSLPYQPIATDTLGSLAMRFGEPAIQDMVLIESPETVIHAVKLDLPVGSTVVLANEPDPIGALLQNLQTHGVSLVLEDIVALNLDRDDLLVPGTDIGRPTPADENAVDVENAVAGEDGPPPSPDDRITVGQNDTLGSIVDRLPGATLNPEPLTEDERLARAVGLLSEIPAMLRTGATIVLPSFSGYTPTAGQSIGSIAETFGLDPSDLLSNNGEVLLGPPVQIPSCARLTVGDVRRAFAEFGTVETTGAAVTRYFLHGLRLPDPDDFDGVGFSSPSPDSDLVLKPLFELLGQQIDVSTSSGETVDETGDDTTGPAETATQVGGWTFELGAPTSMLAVTPAAIGELGAAADAYQQLLGEQADSALANSLTAITEDRPFVNQIRQFTLDQPATWTRPAEEGETPLFHLAALPDSVRALFDRPTIIEVRADGDGDPLLIQRVSRFDFVARAVTAPSGSGRYTPGLYEIGTTDPKSQADLLTALDTLGPNDRIVVAYADPNGGMRTDDLDDETTALVRTNLSTATRPPDQGLMSADADGDDDDPDVAHPTLTNAKRFLEVLWQGSVTNQQGLYLDYRLAAGASDSGLDVALGADGQGTISFLILWDGQGTEPFGSLHGALAVPFQRADTRLTVNPAQHRTVTEEAEPLSAAIAYGDLDLADFVQANATTPNMIAPGDPITIGDVGYTPHRGDDLLIIAMRLGVSLEELATANIADQIRILGGAPVNIYPRWVVKRSTAAPGTLAMLATRPDQPHGEGGSVEQLVATYNLLGFEVLDNEFFTGSTSGLPVSPQTTTGPDGTDESSGGRLVYRRTIPITALVKDGDQENPYAAVGRTAELGFHLVDLYGNPSRELRQVAVDIRYRDPVLGVEGWPGVEARYAIDPDRRTLNVTFAVDLGRLINMHATTPDRWESRLDQDLSGLANAAYQLADERLVASLWSGLDPDVTHPVDRTMLQNVISESTAWVETVAQLQPLVVRREEKTGTSLSTLAADYQVPVGALAAANLDNDRLLRTGAKLAIPGQEGAEEIVTITSRQTLAGIAETHRVTVEQLVGANADRNLVVGKASFTVPLHHLAPENAAGDRWYRVRSRDYLTDIAERFGVSVESLIQANLTMHGILEGGRVIRLASRVAGKVGEVGGPVRELDTFGTLIARLEKRAGATIDLADLVRANEPRTRKEGFKLRNGSMLLIPPKPMAADPVPLTLGTSEDLAPLQIELTLERPAALVDRYLRSSPEVWRATSEIAPALPATTAGASGPNGTERLTPLAQDLAAAAPGWRLGRESRPQYGRGRKDLLIAVRDMPITLEPSAAFYRPTPLATEPWRVAVGEGDDAPVKAVDLNQWNDRCLTLIEVAFSSHLAPRLARLNRQAFTALLDAKGSLAGSIAGRTDAIIATPERNETGRESGRRAAVDVVHQRLLRRLDGLNGDSCVIDYRRSVDDFADLRPTTPRRLFGRAVALDTTFDRARPTPTLRPGEAKIELAGETTKGLTFEVDVAPWPPTVHSQLEWRTVGVEYDVGAGRGDYESSRWITFVVPPDPLDLGTPNVPMPSCTLPDEATLVRDRLAGLEKLGASLLDHRTYAYELDFRFSGDRNDRAELALLINEATGSNELKKPVVDEGHLANIASALANFVADEERLLAELAGDDDSATAAIVALAEHASALAAEWGRLGPMGKGLPLGLVTDQGPSDEGPSDEADEDLLINPGVPTEGSATSTATSRPLDALLANVVAGEVTIIRNEGLVEGRATNPDFILKSHPSRLPIGQRFTTRINAAIDVRTLRCDHVAAPSVADRVSSALSVLTGYGRSTVDGVARPPLDIEIEALVEFGAVDLALRTPVGLWPRRRFDEALGSDVATELARHIAETDADGRWVLQVRVFAGSAPAGAAPLIDYRRVVIPMSSVIRPN